MSVLLILVGSVLGGGTGLARELFNYISFRLFMGYQYLHCIQHWHGIRMKKKLVEYLYQITDYLKSFISFFFKR